MIAANDWPGLWPEMTTDKSAWHPVCRHEKRPGADGTSNARLAILTSDAGSNPCSISGSACCRQLAFRGQIRVSWTLPTRTQAPRTLRQGPLSSLSAGIRCGSQGDPCDPFTQENGLHNLQMVRRQ